MEQVISGYEREHDLHRALMDNICAHVGPRYSQVKAPPDLLRPWLDAWLRSPGTIAAGRAVTDLYRLGSTMWPSLATLLKGGTDPRTETLDPAARGPYGLHVYCRNVAGKTITVQTHAREVIKARSELTGRPLRWDDRPVIVSLEPGEVVDLSLHYAICALREGTWRIHEPELWESSGAIPQRETLIEVAYSCDTIGVDTRHSEPRRKAG